MVDNVSHYNILSFVFFILYSISVSDSEFFGDIIHALCINSTLTSLKLGENILGELFQVCACSQTSIKSSKHCSTYADSTRAVGLLGRRDASLANFIKGKE